MTKRDYGPDRRETRIYLCIGVAVLALTVVAVVARGLPTGAAGYETIGLAAVFSVGTIIWCLRRLRRLDRDGG